MCPRGKRRSRPNRRYTTPLAGRVNTPLLRPLGGSELWIVCLSFLKPPSAHPRFLVPPSHTEMPTPATNASTKPPPPFQPLAAALAWVFPGAGHFFLGHIRRGACITVGILFLFAAGLFIGGISSVDKQENFFWFLGQALNGPIVLGTDYIHQTRFKAYEDPGPKPTISTRADLLRQRRRAAYPYELPATRKLTLKDAGPIEIPVFRRPEPGTNEKPSPPYTRSLGRAGELGTLFITIAGFMNLICIIDAAWRRRYDPAEDGAPAQTRGTGGTGA